MMPLPLKYLLARTGIVFMAGVALATLVEYVF